MLNRTDHALSLRAYDPCAGDIQPGELGKAVAVVWQIDRAARHCATAADLGDVKFQTGGPANVGPVGRPGLRVTDRLRPQLENAGHGDVSVPRIDVNFQRNRLEQRFVSFRGHRRVDAPQSGHFVCVLATQDRLKGSPLVCVRAFIDNELALAVAVVDCAGKPKQTGGTKSVELGVAVMAGVDFQAKGFIAIAKCRQRTELTWATIAAITVGQFPALNSPSSHDGHSFIRYSPFGLPFANTTTPTAVPKEFCLR